MREFDGRTPSPGRPTAALLTANLSLSMENGGWMETTPGRRRSRLRPRGSADGRREDGAAVPRYRDRTGNPARKRYIS